MRIVLTIFICVLIFSGKTVYSQNQKWKSYSDSGLVYKNQKQNAKAIEYYLKAKNELIKDSASSSQAYAQCAEYWRRCMLLRRSM